MKQEKIDRSEGIINSIVADIVRYGAERSYSISLDRFSATNITASGLCEIRLSFDLLTVDNQIGLSVRQLLSLRSYVAGMNESHHQYGIKIAQAPIEYRRLELSTNVEEQFGDGWLATFVVLVHIPLI